MNNNPTTDVTKHRISVANELEVLAKGDSLQALLNHSANDLRTNPTLENMLHVQELINLIQSK